MKPPGGLDLIYLYTYLIRKRACILNLSKFMFDNRKIVIFRFELGGGGGGGAEAYGRTYLYTL